MTAEDDPVRATERALDERDRDHLADPGNAPPMFCRACDFDLRATAGETCPECGGRFNRRATRTFRKKTRAQRRRDLRRILVSLGLFMVVGIALGLLFQALVPEVYRDIVNTYWRAVVFLLTLVVLVRAFTKRRPSA